MGTTSPTQVTMMTEGVRSVGFSLLGGGRDNEGLPLGQPGQNLGRDALRDLYVDHNDPALLELNNPALPRRPRHASVTRDGRNGRAKRGDGLPGGLDGVTITPWSEGYYELCVRYVQAVKYEPMLDERPSEWMQWEEEQKAAKARQSPWE